MRVTGSSFFHLRFPHRCCRGTRVVRRSRVLLHSKQSFVVWGLRSNRLHSCRQNLYFRYCCSGESIVPCSRRKWRCSQATSPWVAKDGKVESNDRRPSFVFDFARKLFAEHLGEKRLVVGLHSRMFSSAKALWWNGRNGRKNEVTIKPLPGRRIASA